ncbi:MAG TPA: polyprenyl synthetase family protein [Jiangellaceae bacterium]|nr:polyprenyl synthetase family protein [Jiangellaceae bacterium]
MRTHGLGIPAVDRALEASLRAGLDEVESRLTEAVKSDDALVGPALRHLVAAGGKRFRPTLALLAGQFGDPDAPGVVRSAVVVELTHVATLYHDDVMDEATVRRGGPSANARWGNSVAILTGDFLFARASQIAADLGTESVRIQARTFERLVQGQLRETIGPRPGQDPVAHYVSVLSDKTASLIATSARLGALHAGVPDEIVDVLTRYGERIGMAFQLADDLLDIVSESTVSGKTPGTDLREGVSTLPMLDVLQGADPADERLRTLLMGPIIDEADHAEALRLLRAHPAMDRARAEVRRWADDAREVLAPLPDVPARHALEAVCDQAVTRAA